jgi:hypothetical protein
MPVSERTAGTMSTLFFHIQEVKEITQGLHWKAFLLASCLSIPIEIRCPATLKADEEIT